eukprot:gnl/Trimastix_PCT/1175.p1 GENE.gnl/Trimastix_PCT/1175~~gnl/Trimastix_PCT/1175.p1  ORF type:complete len:162 (+),score=13.39 gnl/Trimastix_PCT/1175:39-524(+)
MLMGTRKEVIQQATERPPPTIASPPPTATTAATAEPWCTMRKHKRICDKGVPDEATPGDRTRKCRLPSDFIHGVYNRRGEKVRLRFSSAAGVVSLNTTRATSSLPYAAVTNVRSQPIEGHEDYHIVALITGPTDQSTEYLYFVPAQYVEAIKDEILGKFSF